MIRHRTSLRRPPRHAGQGKPRRLPLRDETGRLLLSWETRPVPADGPVRVAFEEALLLLTAVGDAPAMPAVPDLAAGGAA
jgi:hypothetical protein